MMIEKITETRLPNGLVVITDRMSGVRSVTLGFFFRVGSRHEPDELNGISHFIEHTVFKGTERRSAMQIATEQDRLGGGLEAFTTHEETGFAVKVIDDQLPAAFDLIADMLRDPKFDPSDLKSEQRVIIEEIKMVDDSPEEKLGEIFSSAFFAGHPLGLNITGTPKTVKTFDHATTRNYHTQAYLPANLVIAAAGNIEHREIVEMSAKYFGGETNGRRRRLSTRLPMPAAPVIIKQNKNLEQAHLVLATPFVSAADRTRYAADLLANALGGGSSSRLWQKIREERGLAYSVGASAIMYRDCGIFSVFAGTSPDKAVEAVEIVVRELAEIVRDGITDDELDLVKDQARAGILLDLEDSAARAAALAQCEMVFGRQISPEETIEGLMAVTPRDIRAIARKFFHTDKLAFAALGDLDRRSFPKSLFEIDVK